MTSQQKDMIAGGAIGAVGLAVVYGIVRSRKAILQPALSPGRGEYCPVDKKREHEHKHEKHAHKKKHDHRDNDRGEYGRKEHG